jgi:hypothetical protein
MLSTNTPDESKKSIMQNVLVMIGQGLFPPPSPSGAEGGSGGVPKVPPFSQKEKEKPEQVQKVEEKGKKEGTADAPPPPRPARVSPPQLLPFFNAVETLRKSENPTVEFMARGVLFKYRPMNEEVVAEKERVLGQ